MVFVFSEIALNVLLINNFVLALFLGICPFLGVSGKLHTASLAFIEIYFTPL